MNEQLGWRALVRHLKDEAPKWATLLPQLPRLAHQALSQNHLQSLESGLALVLQQQRVRNRWLAVLAALAAGLVAVQLWAALN
jgi:ubiquinone biosynthesis protein